ncbi:MAG: hypothetical protein P1V20_09290 [Verrucomicrobiales bacterium]|nr:hypothetical protein [Verrucomicrobiales bacterium]
MFSLFRFPFQTGHSQSSVRFVAHLLTVGYLAVISLVSSLPGAGLVFFPELAALAFDGFVRPRGTWASVPGFVAFTPVLTAVAGVAVTNWMPFGVPAILLVTLICVLIVQLLRSPVAPAISAGVLPLMTGLESWWYPPAVLFGTGFLALSLIGWKRIAIPQVAESPAGVRDQIDDQMERIPRRWNWIPMLIIFVCLIAGLVKVTGERMILFPPLVVIAFEMFAHPHICPWVRRPARFPVATFLTAIVGVWAVLTFGSGVLATVISVVAGILILKIFDLHMPPALAIGLIPQILDEPGWNYSLSVLIGSTVLAVSFYIYRILLRGGIQQNISPRTENT